MPSSWGRSYDGDRRFQWLVHLTICDWLLRSFSKNHISVRLYACLEAVTDCPRFGSPEVVVIHWLAILSIVADWNVAESPRFRLWLKPSLRIALKCQEFSCCLPRVQVPFEGVKRTAQLRCCTWATCISHGYLSPPIYNVVHIYMQPSTLPPARILKLGSLIVPHDVVLTPHTVPSDLPFWYGGGEL